MSQKLIQKLTADIEFQARYLSELTKWNIKCIKLISRLNLSEDIRVSASSGLFYFWTSSRGDVVELMKLAPEGKYWVKEPSDTGIYYSCQLDDEITVNIHAEQGALPPTCQVVEEDVVIPAQPERLEKRQRLICNQADYEALPLSALFDSESPN